MVFNYASHLMCPIILSQGLPGALQVTRYSMYSFIKKPKKKGCQLWLQRSDHTCIGKPVTETSLLVC